MIIRRPLTNQQIKRKELSEAEKEKARAQGRKATARQRLLNIKAVKAGITVSEEEIQAELKGKK